MTYPVIMHINFCEQGQTIGEICRKAVAWGYDGVEFRRKRIGVPETQDQYLREIEEGVRASGLRHVLFGFPGPALTSADAAERERDVEEAVFFYRHVAERFGVTVVNLITGSLRNPDPSIPYSDYTRHGSFVATEEQWSLQVAGLRAMADALRGVSIRFGFETHMVYLHDTVEAAMRLVREVDRPSVGVNLDYGNIVHFPEPPALTQALATIGDKLHYVHLKNSTSVTGAPGRVATSLAEGEINNRQLLRLLLEGGYTGPLCIEAPRGGDREWYARQDIAYLRSLLREMGA